ncbi:M24 family metallopeptidase [Candidatus Latescibacterota bacterium]
MIQATHELLKEKIRESDLDSLLIGKQSNVRYATGFTGDFGFVAISQEKPVLFTNPLYSEHACSTISESFTVIEVKNDAFKVMADLGISLWGKRVGFESESTICSDFEKMKAAFKGIELISTVGMIEELRLVKNSAEIQSITRAQRIAEKVFSEILEFVREGMQEREIACEIDYRFRKSGGERSAFETIVAFGQNSSKPHAIPTEKKLKNGEIVLFDIGTVCNGYASDMTRTVVFGKADSKLKDIYSTVYEAQEAALDGIRSGMQCTDADKLARKVIEHAGHGDNFVHSLGHGVGLEVHESPLLSPRSESILKKNSVVTVEPGIYYPNWGGVRIEDMVVITDSGCENLTRAPKNLIEL